jgi:type I restriction enzyme R subunit
MAFITEDQLEQVTISWFKELGYAYVFAPELAPDGTTPERQDFRQVILTGRLQTALTRLNPGVPASAITNAMLQLANPNVPGLLASNRQFHRWMTQGLPLKYMDGKQEIGIRLKVIGFDDPAANDWLVVNQLAITGAKHNRRPDMVVYRSQCWNSKTPPMNRQTFGQRSINFRLTNTTFPTSSLPMSCW